MGFTILPQCWDIVKLKVRKYLVYILLYVYRFAFVQTGTRSGWIARETLGGPQRK